MKSQRYRPPRLTRQRASSVSARYWRMRRENGLPRIGRSVPSVKQRFRIGWERRSPMPGDMHSSRWSELPVKMIWMRQISLHQRRQRRKWRGPTGNNKGHLNGRLDGGRKAVSSPSKPIFDLEASATLRDRLLAEVKDLNSAEEAANWAHRVIGSKNTLTADDAARVEQAFQITLATLAAGRVEEPHSSHKERGPTDRQKRRGRPTAIDKTVLALPASRRIRDREHVKLVAKQPCLVCGRHPADAHHLRFAQSRALGCKVSDEFTVPLCRGHHREVHHCGDEAAWWHRSGIDPTVSARALWLETHPLPPSPTKGDHSRSSARRDQN